MFSKKNAKEMELSILQEVFRTLKSNIQFSEKENKIKSITITSCGPGEGKTTIASNLAVTLASSDIKTLLVDAEFRKLEKSCFVENDTYKELSRCDFREINPDKLVKHTNIKNLSYLSIGSSITNPEMLIDSKHLKTFVNSLIEKFDMVIIDAPPLGGAIDSALVASNTDATILVIRSKLHDYHAIQQAKEQLERADARVLGVVLSKVDYGSFKSYFKYQNYCRSDKTKESTVKVHENNKNESKLAHI